MSARRRRSAELPGVADSGNGPRRVRWQRLTLRGFGPYQNEVTVRFPGGFGTLAAPNESGKSTLVAGLLAVVYGLRGTNAPGGAGQGRYRHWGGAARFDGEVEFTGADGTTYVIARNFETHGVRLTRMDAGGATVELNGVHNPGAHRPNEQYERRVAELVGVPSQDLLETTFVVTQPLPETDQVDKEVQTLLSGAGGGHYPAALDLLVEDLTRLTRFTGDLGVKSRNANKDRALEELGQEVRQLEERIEAGRAGADALQALAQQKGDLEQRRQTGEEALRTREKVQRAQQDWLRLAEGYRSQSRRRADLRKALDSARELGQKLSGLTEALAKWPELAQAPAGTDEQLEQVAVLAQRVDSLDGDTAARRRAETAARERATAATEALRRDYGSVAGRPHLLRDLQDLGEQTAELAALEHRLTHLQEEEEAVAAALAARPNWEGLGRPVPDAVARLEQQAEEALRFWRGLTDLRAKLTELDTKLNNYGAFDAAEPALLETVRNSVALRADLARRQDEAARALERAHAELRALEEDERRLEADYADVAGLSREAMTALERKLELLEEQQARREVAAAPGPAAPAPRPVAVALAGAVLAALVGVGGALALGWQPVPATLAGAVLALVGAAAGWWLGARRPAQAGLPQRPAGTEATLAAELAGVDQALGPLAATPAHRLGALAQRRQDWLQRQQELAARRAQAPDAAELARLQQGKTAVEQEAAALTERLQPLAGPGEDAAAGLQRWEALRRERTGLAEQLVALCRDEWSAAPELVDGLRVATARTRWRELGALAGLAAAAAAPGHSPGAYAPTWDVGTVAGLARWLAGLAPEFWTECRTAAREWEELATHRDQLKGDQEHIRRPGPDEQPPLTRLQSRIAALKAQVHPFEEHSDLEAVRRQVEAGAQLADEAEKATGEADLLAGQLQELESELSQQREALAAARAPVEAPLAATGGDVAGARARWRERSEAQAELITVQAALGILLTTWEASSPEELHLKAGAAEDAALIAHRDLQALVQKYPGLPELEQATNPVAVQEQMASLDQEVERLRSEHQATLKELEELTLQETQLHGRDPVNIAAAELDLAELQRQHRELQLEANVLATAHRELRAAVQEYQASHRDRLEATASRYYAAITGREGRRVRLDEQFRVAVLETDGTQAVPAQLSQGAQDQLYLSLRLAIADLVSGDLQLPFLFDDPFHNCDAGRLERIRDTLTTMAGERQIVLLSHREDLGNWGTPVALERGGAG